MYIAKQKLVVIRGEGQVRGMGLKGGNYYYKIDK